MNLITRYIIIYYIYVCVFLCHLRKYALYICWTPQSSHSDTFFYIHLVQMYTDKTTCFYNDQVKSCVFVCTYMCIYMYIVLTCVYICTYMYMCMYIHIRVSIRKYFTNPSVPDQQRLSATEKLLACDVRYYITQLSVESLSQLLAYYHHLSYFSYTLYTVLFHINQIYQTMSCMIGYFRTTGTEFSDVFACAFNIDS